MNKHIIYSTLGGILEFYDFIIFAIFSKIISTTFFPNHSSISALLLTFTIFAAGYIIRPVGGLIYGHFGDKFGRKKTFSISIIMMAFSTLFIAFIPSYASIGIFAPILLTILRLIQGASIGGEIPGALTFVSESIVKRKTLACSIVFFGLVLGIILGQLTSIVINKAFTVEQVNSFGWRIAFILGGVFGIWGGYLRKKIHETPSYLAIEDHKTKYPFLDVLKKHPKEIFMGWALMGLVSSGIMVFFLIMPSYGNLVEISSNTIFLINTLVLFIVTLASICFGFLGDKINKKYLILAAAIISILLTYTIFSRLVTNELTLVSYCVFCIFSFGISVAVIPSVLTELFPTELRYTGVGLIYNLSFATTGGLAPMLIFYFISETGNLLMPAFYYVLISIIALVSLLLYPKQVKHLAA
ncbi:MFS transporter [Paraphotobacterium marinum]|uniref:MFS transporter n=1 Tax=Paraphotobacterium marinum TaxID=1755811 RepID=A0A220VG39_9GAMM|nr:MFS transporter [Paraphotobacterium marinum]ASK79327.1 MFS transporter [Paraphotobacterium marinum]